MKTRIYIKRQIVSEMCKLYSQFFETSVNALLTSVMFSQ